MISHSCLLLKVLGLLLAFAHLGTCVYPPADHRPRFNCPQAPPPVGVDGKRFESLYRYCTSRVPSCNCYEDPRVVRLQIPVYRPLCDVLRATDESDKVLQGFLRFCETRCMCHGGPQENFARWPGGPAALDI